MTIAILATIERRPYVISVSAPSAAIAPSGPRRARGMVFVLRGSLSHYTAASGSTTGSISIMVRSSNLKTRTLSGMTLTFATDGKTNVVLHGGKPIADGDRGIVKVRAAKGSDAAALQAQTAFEVIDQGSHI